MQFNRIYVQNAHGRSLSRDNLQLDCHNIDGFAVGVNRVDFLAAARDTATGSCPPRQRKSKCSSTPLIVPALATESERKGRNVVELEVGSTKLFHENPSRDRSKQTVYLSADPTGESCAHIRVRRAKSRPTFALE